MQFLCLKQGFFFIWLTVSLSLLLCLPEAVIDLPENTTIPALFVFGDSIGDTGNNNYIATLAKANYPPYGQDFMGGKPTGRFSNGKIPSDLIAEELGIKPLLPPYLDPTLEDQDLLTGVSFGSGGSGYDPLTTILTSTLSLSDQLKLFEDYKTKLRQIASEGRASTVLSKSLFLLFAGTNDFVINYFVVPLRQIQYDVPSYANLLVSYSSSFVQDLYQMGARRIGVYGLPPVGCLPLQITLSGGLERKCVDKQNQVAQLFNKKLSAQIISVNSQFPDAKMIYVDIYNDTLDLINNPQKYGFKIANKGCCGTGITELLYLCQFPCSNVSEYIFWDDVHPTEKAYRFLVRRNLKKYINLFI